jgi:hypothetical protein
MRLRRTGQDMFGRPLPPAPAPVAAPRASRLRRPIPPGLVPFIPVFAVVAVLVALLLVPILGIVLLVACLGTVIWMRYRAVKDVDYYTLRRRDPLYRAFDDYRRRRNGSDDRDR